MGPTCDGHTSRAMLWDGLALPQKHLFNWHLNKNWYFLHTNFYLLLKMLFLSKSRSWGPGGGRKFYQV